MSAAPLTTPGLSDVLGDAGHAPEWLRFDDGTRLLLLPAGGRVLGLLAGDDPVNFLWTNPALAEPSSARVALADPHWPNPGGDRTWVAPEHDFFIADLERLGETYRPPASIDPGSYRLERDGNGVRFTQQAEVHRHRSDSRAHIEISKTIRAAQHPLPETDLDDVTFAGYATAVTLTLLDDTPSPIGLWQLLQLPHRGELIVPTRGRARPRRFAGDLTACPATCTDDALHWPMGDRNRTHKIGLRANEIIGRAGYVRRGECGEVELVIRAFDVDPAGLYVDVPLDALDEEGYAFQACNVAEPAVGLFAELEHHAPAIGGSTGRRTHTDLSDVWAFRGTRSAINRIGRALLCDSFSC